MQILVGNHKNVYNAGLMKIAAGSFVAAGVFCLWVSTACAEYEILLKNGRRIAVESFREEAGQIKFPGLGGEIGIARSEVSSIRKAGEGSEATLDLTGPVTPATPVAPREKQPTKTDGDPKRDTKLQPADEKTKEEKDYQNKLAQLTNRLRELQEQYSAATRGTTGTEPSFFTTEEAFKGHQQDLLSRLRAADAPIAPPETETEKRLTQLREQMFQLEKQRQGLIEEMKRKGFTTAEMF